MLLVMVVTLRKSAPTGHHAVAHGSPRITQQVLVTPNLTTLGLALGSKHHITQQAIQNTNYY